MRRRRPGLRLLIAAALVLLPVAPAHATSSGADVHGDDEGDVYVGSGGLILPGSVDMQTRQQVAACSGCSWRLTTPCVASALGNAFGSGCTSVVRGCPGGRLLRSWFRPEGSAWRETGLVCLGPGGPVTVAAVGRAAADRARRGIPGLTPAFEPPAGVVTQLPVLFTSGQAGGEQHWEWDLAGHAVTVSARPSWEWDFGDGAATRTLDPGAGYPRGGVDHVYRTAGRRIAACTTTWSAHFRVDGLGPFPVPEPLVQRASFAVPVGEGRAVLVPAGTRSSPGGG